MSRLISITPKVGGRATLFAFPHAGGGGSIFRNWPSYMGPSWRVATVTLPGRGASLDQPPLRDFGIAVERIGREAIVFAKPPFALFGHSLGAALAFEVARWLARRGHPPAALIIAGRPAPQFASGDPRKDPALESLSDNEFVAFLRRMGGTPPEILANDEMMAMLLPAIRGDFALSASHRLDSDARLDCPFLVLGGRDDAYAKPVELEGWRVLTTESVRVCLFDGGHFFLTTRETEICAAIAEFVEDVSSK